MSYCAQMEAILEFAVEGKLGTVNNNLLTLNNRIQGNLEMNTDISWRSGNPGNELCIDMEILILVFCFVFKQMI